MINPSSLCATRVWWGSSDSLGPQMLLSPASQPWRLASQAAHRLFPNSEIKAIVAHSLLQSQLLAQPPSQRSDIHSSFLPHPPAATNFSPPRSSYPRSLVLVLFISLHCLLSTSPIPCCPLSTVYIPHSLLSGVCCLHSPFLVSQAPLHYYTTTLQHHYTTTPLHHYTTPLHHYTTTPQTGVRNTCWRHTRGQNDFQP